MNKKRILDLVLQEKYREAYILIKKYPIKKINEILIDFAYSTEDEKIYYFVLYLIKNEKNKKLLSEYHVIAAGILAIAIPYLSYSYKEASIHAREALKLLPADVETMEFFLFIYEDPSSKDYISNKEAKKVARDILKIKPASEIANKVLNTKKQQEAKDKKRA
jgi:hypothetical protein